MPVLPSGDAIDSEWLSAQLNLGVEALEIEPLGVPQGFVSNTMRLKPQGPSSALPDSLILKIDSENPVGRELALHLNCFAREVGFYQSLAPQLAPLVPHAYAMGNGSSDEGRWLLLEDLSAMAVGNQVRGVTAKACGQVLEAIAAVHARFWMSPALRNHDWLPDHQFWFQGSSETLLAFHRSFLEDYELRVEPEALEAIALAIEHSQAIDAAIAHRPFTLVHADLRVENVLFARNASQRDVVLLDWGTPTRSMAAMDLAFLIGGSVPMPARRGRLHDLCRQWHQSLKAHGVKDYSFSDAWADVQLAALRCLSSVLFLHNWQLDPNITSRAMLLDDEWIERCCALVVELDALELLKTFG